MEGLTEFLELVNKTGVPKAIWLTREQNVLTRYERFVDVSGNGLYRIFYYNDDKSDPKNIMIDCLLADANFCISHTLETIRQMGATAETEAVLAKERYFLICLMYKIHNNTITRNFSLINVVFPTNKSIKNNLLKEEPSAEEIVVLSLYEFNNKEEYNAFWEEKAPDGTETAK